MLTQSKKYIALFFVFISLYVCQVYDLLLGQPLDNVTSVVFYLDIYFIFFAINLIYFLFVERLNIFFIVLSLFVSILVSYLGLIDSFNFYIISVLKLPSVYLPNLFLLVLLMFYLLISIFRKPTNIFYPFVVFVFTFTVVITSFLFLFSVYDDGISSLEDDNKTFLKSLSYSEENKAVMCSEAGFECNSFENSELLLKYVFFERELYSKDLIKMIGYSQSQNNLDYYALTWSFETRVPRPVGVYYTKKGEELSVLLDTTISSLYENKIYAASLYLIFLFNVYILFYIFNLFIFHKSEVIK